MKRHSISITLGAIALTATSPVLAQLLGNQGGGVSAAAQGALGAQGGVGASVRDSARVGAQGSINADANAATRANANSAVKGAVDATTDTAVKTGAKVKGKAKTATDTAADVAADARAKAQGAANASVKGLSKASTNSALNVAGRTDLSAVTEGTVIKGSGGADIGTVSEVVLNREGAVVGVMVNLEGGGTTTIPASTLTVDGSVVTTTYVHKH